MYVNYSGWREGTGTFSCKIFVDETKEDYVINYQSGRIRRQATPFEYCTHDWNNDGDVYTQFGAFFDVYNRNGEIDWRVFMTVEDMVFDLAKSVNGDTFGVDDPVVSIPGIEVSPLNERPSLKEAMNRSERQVLAQDIERNRKMATLGIRRPGEPWVR